MPVDVWGGMNQGLASLNNTFEDMAKQRQWDEQQARQARMDSLQEPILKARGEGAVLDLEEKRRKMGDLRAYDAARKYLEANPGTIPTVTDRGNPAYKPAVPEGLNSTMTYAGEGNQVTPGKPSEGLPAMDVTGTRPLNPAEMASRRMMLAVQHGQYDEVAKIGTIMDITDKIQGNESAMLAKMVANAKANRQIIGPEAALVQLKREALAAGVPKEMVDKFTMNRDGIIAYPDGQGGMIAIVETPDGKSHVQHVTAKDPKSPTQIDVETRAAQGDPLAMKIIKDQEARKADLKRIEAGSGAGGGAPYVPGASILAPGERDDNALKGLSAGDAATVKGLVDYKIPLPSGFALKTPWGQRILAAAVSYDPAFDATQYNVRLQLKKGFNSGKEATNIRGLNTAISHLETLDKKAKELSNSWSPTWNSVSNAMITAAGDPRVRGFDMAATAVESELAAVFKGMGATDQEIKAWRTNLNAAGSPKQLKEAIDTGVELLGGRLQALQSQYETGLGKPKDFHFLSEKSRAILKKLGANVDAIDGVAGTGMGSGGGTKPAPSGATHAATRDTNGNWTVAPVGGR
jgi:hypothetical protein